MSATFNQRINKGMIKRKALSINQAQSESLRLIGREQKWLRGFTGTVCDGICVQPCDSTVRLWFKEHRRMLSLREFFSGAQVTVKARFRLVEFTPEGSTEEERAASFFCWWDTLRWPPLVPYWVATVPREVCRRCHKWNSNGVCGCEPCIDCVILERETCAVCRGTAL